MTISATDSPFAKALAAFLAARPAGRPKCLRSDLLTSNHIRNWMECVRRRRQPNAPVEAGYSHSTANIMTTAAVRTGLKSRF